MSIFGFLLGEESSSMNLCYRLWQFLISIQARLILIKFTKLKILITIEVSNYFMTKAEIVKKLKEIEQWYLWANLAPVFVIVFTLAFSLIHTLTNFSYSILSTLLLFIFFFGTYFVFSFWIQRAKKLITGERVYVGWISILAFILLFIPFINLIALGLFIYNWYKSYKSLSDINKKLDVKSPLEKFVSVYAIPLFLVFIVVITSLTINTSYIAISLSLILLLVVILSRLSILRMMRKTRKAIEKTDLDLGVTIEQLKPNNKNTDIPKFLNFLTSINWQYAKNGKLFFIKFNQGSIAEVTSKEETQETKFYNWRINNGYLFCDNPDFKGGGQILGDLIQFKNLTLSPKLSSKTVSSTDNK